MDQERLVKIGTNLMVLTVAAACVVIVVGSAVTVVHFAMKFW